LRQEKLLWKMWTSRLWLTPSSKGYQETFAEIDSALKNTISHRAIATETTDPLF
jgi:hypothetical protein